MDILRLSEVSWRDLSRAGAKSANLGELLRLNLPVPDGFIIPVDAYAACADSLGLYRTLAPYISAQDWSGASRAAAAAFASRPMDAHLEETVAAAYRRMGSPAVAVRSSATAEDLPAASFAGQHATVLNVQGEDLLIDAVRSCWSSLWSEQALAYRHARRVEHHAVAMAVLVQRMVEPDLAGVLFTVDPRDHYPERILVEVAPGLGDRLVSGQVTGHAVSVDRETLEPVGSGAVPEVLTPASLRSLCAMALEIEDRFGHPQDIEFAVAGGALYLLQTRPVTTSGTVEAEALPVLPGPTLLEKAMKPLTDERYVIAPRPLDNMLYPHLVGAALFTIKRLGGLVRPEDEAAFTAGLWRQAYRFPPVHRLGRVVVTGTYRPFQLLRSDWLAWWERGPRKVLQRISAPDALDTMDEAALLAKAEELLRIWTPILRARFYGSSAIQSEQLLRMLVTLAVGRRERDRVMADLMTALPNPTLEINRALWRLSRLARDSKAVLSAVRAEDPAMLERSEEGRAFLGELRRFLGTYGHREGTCWYLSTPTWRRDPLQVYRLLSTLAAIDAFPHAPDRAEARYRTSRERALHGLRVYPGLGRLFRWLLERMRALQVFREQSHLDLALPLDAVQQITGELGNRLAARGSLARIRDIYYLTFDELRTWILGTWPPLDEVRGLIARRRATYRAVNANWQKERAAGRSAGGTLKGIGVGPGIVSARVRVVTDQGQFHQLRPGEVLVCSYTNPAWTPLFASVSAVVTETGGAASHAAIVAREYGIPAVMAVPGATKTLATGEEVLVDGTRGTVTRLSASQRNEFSRSKQEV